MSLNSKSLLAFIVFSVFSAIVGCFSFVVPISILGIALDPSGQASGFLTGMLLVITPIISLPVGIIAGFLVLPLSNRVLKVTTRLRSDYVVFLIAIALSGLLGIVMTYMTALLLVFYWGALMKFLGIV